MAWIGEWPAFVTALHQDSAMAGQSPPSRLAEYMAVVGQLRQSAEDRVRAAGGGQPLSVD
jgi:hypothetical protein